MKFTRDSANDLSIRRIESGSLQVGEETYAHSIAITAERVIDDWQPLPLAELDSAALAPLLTDDTEVVVLGTGNAQQFPPRALVFELARRGVGLETMDTPAACRTFNILIGEGRQPLAILLLD